MVESKEKRSTNIIVDKQSFSEEEIRSALLSRVVPQTEQDVNEEPENDIQFKKQEHEENLQH